MNLDGKLFRKMSIIGTTVAFFLFGAVILLFGFITLSGTKVELADVDATIVEKSYELVGDSYQDTFYVDYNVDGVDYTHVLVPESNSNWNVGDTITVKYEVENPGQLNNEVGIFPYILLAAGAALIAAGIIVAVIRVKKSKQLDSQENQYKREQEQINDGFSPYEPTEKHENEVKYYCLLDKKFKQGLYWEDENRNKVYEALMDQIRLVGSTPFTFINHLTNETKHHEVGHTTTTDMGGMNQSWFKFDGVNIWDYLHQKGIRIKTELSSNLITANYHVLYHGEEIAYIKMTGVYVHEEDAKGAMGSGIPCKGFYRVTTKEVDIELIFLVTFALSRTDQLVVE